MNYDPDDFLHLMEEAERQGGAHLPDPCEPLEYRIKLPDASGRMRWKRSYTTGCGKDKRFALPYEPVAATEKERAQMVSRGAGFVTVCAVDDDMGKWPRFAGIVEIPPNEPEAEENGS